MAAASSSGGATERDVPHQMARPILAPSQHQFVKVDRLLSGPPNHNLSLENLNSLGYLR